MRLLLDTHIAIWMILDDPQLSTRARALTMAPANEVHVSAASLWEIAIKHTLNRHGRADMRFSRRQALLYFKLPRFRMLAITDDHTIAVETLPLLHGDPFDRLIVAQALAEPMRLLTHDKAVAAYSDTIVAV
jgi:PIN domain nuclease of toxin-antitoxin system